MRKHFLYCATALLVASVHFANIPLMWIGGVLLALVVLSILLEYV